MDSPLQTHFFAHIPGILTGVGIIGTFTGLIAGLIGFDVSNPAQVQSELSQLVQTVGHAFLVSALAITLAMVFTWLEKSLLTGRYQQVEQLQQNLDSLFKPHAGRRIWKDSRWRQKCKPICRTKFCSNCAATQRLAHRAEPAHAENLQNTAQTAP